MKKLSLIPFGILIVAGIVFASGLFPTIGPVARLPVGPGTIGGVLGFFRFDGTSQDANMLSGVYASGYLHNKDCSTEFTNKIWQGVDADGRGICGNISGLLAIAHFTELYGTVNVWHNGASGYVPAILGESLYQGDLIESDSTGTGTIAFDADNSIIRFWIDTDLELSYGSLGTETVAQVILNDGRLWGRILSATGLNLGGGGMVTGVRGTSIDINKLLGVYTVSITDSVYTTSTIKPKENYVVMIMKDGVGSTIPAASTFGGGTRLTYVSGSSNIKKESLDKNIFYSDKWFVKNGLLDITYMSDLLAGPVFLPAPLRTRLNNELNTTIELNNTGTLLALLDSPAAIPPIHWDDAVEYLNHENTPTPETPDDINKRKLKRLECKKLGKTYFYELDACKESWNTLATTDFATLTGTLYGKKDKWNYTESGSINMNPTNTGEYMEYSGSYTNLLGKTITIELDSPVGTDLVNPADDRWYVMDFGSGNRYFVFKGKKCSGSPDVGINHLCKPSDLTDYGIVTTLTTFTLNIPVTPSKLFIGNSPSGTPAYKYPIGSEILKMTIQ